jgi:hypothetical protein
VGALGISSATLGFAACNRGLRLAQAAMQMLWQQEAERQRLSQVSSPEQVLEFIRSQPGLAVTCEDYLPYLAAYVPQLTMRRSGNVLSIVSAGRP